MILLFLKSFLSKYCHSKPEKTAQQLRELAVQSQELELKFNLLCDKSGCLMDI